MSERNFFGFQAILYVHNYNLKISAGKVWNWLVGKTSSSKSSRDGSSQDRACSGNCTKCSCNHKRPTPIAATTQSHHRNQSSDPLNEPLPSYREFVRDLNNSATRQNLQFYKK